MPRSLRVQRDWIEKVKLALRRNGFPSQRSLAEEVGFALATVSNFLNGKPVDYATFEELCRRLALEWREIAELDFQVSSQTRDKKAESPELSSAKQEIQPLYPSGSVPLGSPFYLERAPLEKQVNQEIRKPGALVRIKAPREMGKTSLMVRILDYAKRLGYRTVSLNLEQVDQAILSDLNQLQRHWATLSKQPELAQALDTVLNATEPVPLDPILAYKLSSIGLIKQSGDKAIAGCELYRRYFTKNGQQHSVDRKRG